MMTSEEKIEKLKEFRRQLCEYWSVSRHWEDVVPEMVDDELIQRLRSQLCEMTPHVRLLLQESHSYGYFAWLGPRGRVVYEPFSAALNDTEFAQRLIDMIDNAVGVFRENLQEEIAKHSTRSWPTVDKIGINFTGNNNQISIASGENQTTASIIPSIKNDFSAKVIKWIVTIWKSIVSMF